MLIGNQTTSTTVLHNSRLKTEHLSSIAHSVDTCLELSLTCLFTTLYQLPLIFQIWKSGFINLYLVVIKQYLSAPNPPDYTLLCDAGAGILLITSHLCEIAPPSVLSREATLTGQWRQVRGKGSALRHSSTGCPELSPEQSGSHRCEVPFPRTCSNHAPLFLLQLLDLCHLVGSVLPFQFQFFVNSIKIMQISIFLTRLYVPNTSMLPLVYDSSESVILLHKNWRERRHLCLDAW